MTLPSKSHMVQFELLGDSFFFFDSLFFQKILFFKKFIFQKFILFKDMRRELLLEWKDPQLLQMLEGARAELSRNIKNDWLIPYVELDIHENQLIGSGSYGSVFFGTYSGCPCAMKSIRVNAFETQGGFSKQTITREIR